MVYKNNKKGQAAIEFLMTYGWMLLIVLIVGALIFSFVDFGALLPNKVELNNNLRAAQTESFAKIGIPGDSDGGKSHVVAVFKYVGSQRIVINGTSGKSSIMSDLNSNKCPMTWLRNADTDTGTINTAEQFTSMSATNAAAGGEVVFINGQTGVAVFDCTNINGVDTGFYENDVLEGKIQIEFKNAKTGVPTPSSGSLRLGVTSN